MISPRPAPFATAPDRGSVLLVSLLFGAIIALSLGSFLQLATTSSRFAYRTYYAGVAMNLAECGLEQGMWSINRARTDTDAAWSDWTVDDSTHSAQRTFDYGILEGGANAVVKVYTRERDGTRPAMIVSRAIITTPNSPPVEKWVRVTLRKRSRYDTGAVGKDGVTFNGNNTGAASWNSDPDKDPNTPYIPWSSSVNNDSASVATTTVTSTAEVKNADINGKVAVGSSSTDAINVGAQGYVGPFGTPAGTKDPDSISTDFTADLEDISAPTIAQTATGQVSIPYNPLGSVTNDLTLPKNPSTDLSVVDANGVQTYYYEATEIKLTGKALTITEGYNVVIHVPNYNTAVSVGGGDGAINVNTKIDDSTGAITAASLHLYTPGTISIAGKGVGNEVPGDPIYGTGNKGTPKFSI